MIARVAPLAIGWAATLAAGGLAGSRPLFALAALWLVPVPVVIARRLGRPFDALEPIWLVSIVFLFTYMVVPAGELFRAEPFESLRGGLKLSPPHFYAAMWLSGLGFLALCAGYFAPVGGRVAGRAARDVPRASIRALVLTGLGLTAVGLIALEFTLVGVEAWNYSPREVLAGGLRIAILELNFGRGYINVGFQALGFGLVCLLLALAYSAVRGSGRRRLVIPAYVAASVFSIVVFGGVLGSRSFAVVTLIQLLVVLHLAYRPLPPRLVMGAFAVLAALSVAVLVVRIGSGGLDPLFYAGLVAKTFDGFNFLVTAIARVDGLLWGRTIAEDIGLTYLPRAVFPDKPTIFGIVAAQDAVIPGFRHPNATFPPGMLAEGYLNFGPLGAIALPAVVGLVLRAVYDWANASRAAVAVIVLGYFVGNQAGLFRGVGPVIPAVLVMLVLLAPLLVPERVRGRLRAARPRPGRLVGALAAAGALLVFAAMPVVLDPIVRVREADGLFGRTGAADQGPRPALMSALPRTEARDHGDLVLFWASWCADCRAAVDQVAGYQRSTGRDVQGVAYQDTPANVRRAMGEARASWTNAIDDGRLTISVLRAPKVPSVLMLNERGDVGCVLEGVTDATQLAAISDRLRSDGGCTPLG